MKRSLQSISDFTESIKKSLKPSPISPNKNSHGALYKGASGKFELETHNGKTPEFNEYIRAMESMGVSSSEDIR